MKPHRLSVRFYPNHPEDCKAWEHLQSLDGSRNRAVITAINTYFGQQANMAEVVRKTIRECLEGQQLTIQVAPEQSLTEDDEALLDAMDSFLGM